MSQNTKPKVTIDTNCIIGLEEDRDYAPVIRELIKYHDQGEIELQIVAISASEKQLDGKMAASFSLFTNRLKKDGLDKAKILHPPMMLGITYLGSGRFIWREMAILKREIHSILSPDLPEEFSNFEKIADKNKPGWQWTWRNQLCDVLAYACHLDGGGGLFVSNDKGFHGRNREHLLNLFGGEIVRPIEASSRLLDSKPFKEMPIAVKAFINNTYAPGDLITDAETMRAFKVTLGIPVR